MALRCLVAAFLSSTLHVTLAASMECGEGVPLCGILTLQTGLGQGVYNSNRAKVHGLWPETGSYGNSQCIKPRNMTPPTKIYECYSGESDQHALWFETHEWTKHGECAGVQDVDDFFNQVCSLAKDPLAVLESAKEAGKDFQSLAESLRNASYPVWGLDSTNDQVELSACAGNDGRWVLAAVADMSSKCGGPIPAPSPGPQPSPGPTPGPQPSPAPTPDQQTCVPSKKGPACSTDADCTKLHGCVRCAHSGFCTDEPLAESSLHFVLHV